MIKICPQCGRKNLANANFCVFCGAKLGEAVPDPEAATAAGDTQSQPAPNPSTDKPQPKTAAAPSNEETKPAAAPQNNPYQQFSQQANTAAPTPNTTAQPAAPSAPSTSDPANGTGNPYQRFNNAAQPQTPPAPTAASGQPQTATLQQVQQTGTSSFFRRHKTWFIVAGALILAFIIYAAVQGGGSGSSGTSGSDDVAEGIEKDILDNDDYGNATVTWSTSKGYVIHIPSDARVLQELNDGSPSIWNALVRDVQDESKAIADKGGYSGINIVNPADSSRYFLQVREGKVRYNIADDLN